MMAYNLPLFLSLVYLFKTIDQYALQENVPAKIYMDLYYSNVRHYSRSGWCDIWAGDRGCDVYFRICIFQFKQQLGFQSNRNSKVTCDVAYKKTNVFANAGTVRFHTEDFLQFPVYNNVPEYIRVRIEVWDKDSFTSDDHITTFLSGVFQLKNNLPFSKMNLLKLDETSYTKDISMVVQLKLECSLNYFGKQCEKYCQADYISYHCGQNGERICYPGYHGHMCSEIDHCFTQPCAPYAQCTNLLDNSGRECFCNGGNGPECYKLFNACDPSPCLNNGTCNRTGIHLQQFVCSCHGHWYGPTCEKKYSSCQSALKALQFMENESSNKSIAVCANDGQCVDDPNEFKHACICQTGWTGNTCETRTYNLQIIVSVLIFLFCTTFIIVLVVYLRKKCSKPTPKIEIIHAQPQFNTNSVSKSAVNNSLYENEFDTFEYYSNTDNNEYDELFTNKTNSDANFKHSFRKLAPLPDLQIHDSTEDLYDCPIEGKMEDFYEHPKETENFDKNSLENAIQNNETDSFNAMQYDVLLFKDLNEVVGTPTTLKYAKPFPIIIDSQDARNLDYRPPLPIKKI